MVTIRIKENSKQAKALIEMLKTFPFVEFKEEPDRYNEETEKAIRDAREGKKYDSRKKCAGLIKQTKGLNVHSNCYSKIQKRFKTLSQKGLR